MGWIFCLWLPLAFLLPHGDLEEHIEELSAAIRLYPDSMSLYQQRGDLYIQTEEFKEAKADFYSCLHSGHLNPGVYLGLSQSLFYLHLPDSSLYYADLAIATDSTFASMEWKGASLLHSMRYCESVKVYAQLLSSAQHPSPALFIDASLASRQCPDGSPTAEAFLKDGIARIGKLHVLEQELVRVYLYDKRYEEALQAQSEIIQQRSVKAGPYYDRAEIYLLMNDKTAAINDLHQALISIEKLPAYKSSTPALQEMKKKIISLLNQLER